MQPPAALLSITPRWVSPPAALAHSHLHPSLRVPVSPSPLTALPCREHQLVVAVKDNDTSLEGACSGEPQPFNASQQPGAYVAAVLNLTAPTEFVLGNGTHGQGYHNAALRPGWDYMVLLRLVRRSQQVPSTHLRGSGDAASWGQAAQQGLGCLTRASGSATWVLLWVPVLRAQEPWQDGVPMALSHSWGIWWPWVGSLCPLGRLWGRSVLSCPSLSSNRQRSSPASATASLLVSELLAPCA